MRVLSIVGARPQFVKLGVICRAVERFPKDLQHRILHTGQHYDYEMSEVFFRELGIPMPDFNLGVGSGPHGAQTGAMLSAIEEVLCRDRPDWVLVYGDTNSTLAGALASAKLHVPVAHVEAGLRSFNRRMPEEINRIVTDHVSTLLLCPSETAIQNLEREGLGGRATWTGDVMLDAVLYARDSGSRKTVAPEEGDYALATLHRAENTDDRSRLIRILTALERVSEEVCPVRLYMHPRTRAALSDVNWSPKFLRVNKPLSYFEMISAVSRAQFLLTDSGGLQKEAYFLQTPCITLRHETEWVETLHGGCNVVVGDSGAAIHAAAAKADSAGPWGTPYGTGEAGIAVIQALLAHAATL
jgi:UDP-GlcNAc3NAcA epimerase